jgi:fructose-specific phosphotransferase system IIA component
MKVRKHLRRENIILDLKSDTKEAVIEEMIDNLFETGKIKDKDKALDAVLAREKKMTTGMQHGVAIPHGKTDSVSELITAIGIKKGGIDFNSMDKEPSKIFIMTVSPSSHSGPHIQFLAEVSKVLKSEEMRNKFLNAEKEEDIIDIF